MKLGNISKYISDVNMPGKNTLVDFPPKFKDMSHLSISNEDALGNLVDSVVKQLKAFFETLKKHYESWATNVERKAAEAKDSMKQWKTQNKNGVIQLHHNLSGVIMDDGQVSSAKAKENITLVDGLRKKVNAIINRSERPSSPGELTKYFQTMRDDIEQVSGQLAEKVQEFTSAPRAEIEYDGSVLNEFEKILTYIGDISKESLYTNIDIDKVLTNLNIDSEEDREAIVKAMSMRKEAGDAIEEYARARLRFLASLVSGIAKATYAGETVASKEDYDSQEIIDGLLVEPDELANGTQPLCIGTQPDNALFKQLHTISTEALVIGNFARYFSRKADSLNIAVQEGFKYLTTYNYDPMETLHPAQMSNYVSTLDFMEHETLKVPQPNGFKGELLPYTVMLIERTAIMNKVLTDVIQPATSRFGHYLSLPMDRAERRDFEFGITIADDRDKLAKEEAKLFGGNRSATVSLGTLFNSFNDFVDSERNMLTVKSTLGEGGMDSVKKAVNALVITAGALIKRLGQDSSSKPSGEFVKMVSEQLTEVARWVEWYSAQMTRIIETNNALYEVEKMVLKL